MKSTKKLVVVVIGAGPSGLVAIKEMLQAGHEVIAIEKAPEIGGVFRVAKDWSYQELYLTISNYFMAFSDFAPPLQKEGNIRYSTQEEYFDYLKAYTKHFGLRKHIHFNTIVTSAVLNNVNQKWIITAEQQQDQAATIGGNDNTILTFHPDALIVATGSNHVPNIITLNGNYTGQVLHSSQYREPTPFKNKNVLVVGAGESASDVVNQTSMVGAKSVTVWTRRPQILAPRFLQIDTITRPYNEYKLLKNQQQQQQRQLKHHDDEICNVEMNQYDADKNNQTIKITSFLETSTISRYAGYLPIFFYGLLRHVLNWANSTKIRLRSNTETLKLHLSYQWMKLASQQSGDFIRADQVGSATKNAHISVLAAHDKINTVIAPNAIFNGTSVTFSDTIWYNNQALAKPTTVTMDNNIDVVILCTGFQTKLDWLCVPDECNFEVNPRTWYKHCFPPNLGTKLMFFGWTRPHQGGIPACSELLARYSAMILNKERQLPTNYDILAQQEGQDETKYYCQTPHHKTVIDYPAFTESLSVLIGCRPKCPSPIFEFERFLQYWIYPAWPCWFRQCGPGANRQVLYETLNQLPIYSSYGMCCPDFILSIPIILIMLIFSTILSCIPIVGDLYRKSGLNDNYYYNGWKWIKPRGNILHGNDIPKPSVFVHCCVWMIFLWVGLMIAL